MTRKNTPDPREGLAPLPLPEVQPTLTVAEAGRYLGLRKAASYDAARRGAIPTIQMGDRRFLVPTAEFRRVLGIDAPRGAA